MYTKHTKNKKVIKKSDFKVFSIDRFTPNAQAHIVEFNDWAEFWRTAKYCKCKTFFKDKNNNWYFFSEILLYVYNKGEVGGNGA